ncbi:hypothetical protein LTR04_002809 [Oleoguttula sp. CCFEE 6159]|nr:hypothetical protein LTR04_002809 [Oleoguttula sp. CCFEE 6159]
MHFSASLLSGLALAATAVDAVTPSMGRAAPYSGCASNGIHNSGASTVNSPVACYPAGPSSVVGLSAVTNLLSSVTGLLGRVLGTIDAGTTTAQGVLNDANTCYSTCHTAQPTVTLPNSNLGGLSLRAGVYLIGPTNVAISGTLTLDGQHNPNAVFIIQIKGDLNLAASARILLANGAQACNVFFQVGASATLGSGSIVYGNILAAVSVTVNSGSTCHGNLSALSGILNIIDSVLYPQGTCNRVASASTTTSTTTATTKRATTTTPTTLATTTSNAPLVGVSVDAFGNTITIGAATTSSALGAGLTVNALGQTVAIGATVAPGATTTCGNALAAVTVTVTATVTPACALRYRMR